MPHTVLWFAWAVVIPLLVIATPVRAQNLEPRLYVPLPIDLNILVASFSRASGSVVIDASLPVSDFTATTNSAVLSYARSFSLAGRTAQFQAIAPLVVARANAIVAGQDSTRRITGLADPVLRLAVNLKGGPARRRKDLAGVRFGTILGASLSVGLPLGQYDTTRYINIGANRWSIKPEVGIVQPVGRGWALEAYAGASFFTHNTEYLGSSTVSQAPLLALQGHVIRIIGRRGWVALDGILVSGGETSVDGVVQATFQRNVRVGATGVYTFGPHGVRAAVSSGFYTRFGGDFTVFSVGYSYAWGG